MIFIAVPAYSGLVAAETAISLIRARDEARALRRPAEVKIRTLDSFLPRARNVLVKQFLNSGAELLVFWDADVACAPGDFERLISAEADFVSGAYRFRQDPENFAIRPLPEGWREEGGLIEVEAIGAGFLCITRRAIERMIAHRPGAWFKDTELGPVPELFECQNRDHEMWSEDFVFCARARDAGLRIFIEPRITLTHIGGKAFQSHFQAWLGRRLVAAATPETLAAAKARLDAAYAAARAAA